MPNNRKKHSKDDDLAEKRPSTEKERNLLRQHLRDTKGTLSQGFSVMNSLEQSTPSSEFKDPSQGNKPWEDDPELEDHERQEETNEASPSENPTLPPTLSNINLEEALDKLDEKKEWVPNQGDIIPYLKKYYLECPLTQSLIMMEKFMTKPHLEEFCKILRGPKSSMEFTHSWSVIQNQFNAILVGFKMGADKTLSERTNEITMLREDMKNMKEILHQVVTTTQENVQKFQTECSSVSKELRTLVAKVEQLCITKSHRSDANLEVYHPAPSTSIKTISFLCNGYPCRLQYENGVKNRAFFDGHQELSVSRDVLKEFCTRLKELRYEQALSIRGKEVNKIIVDYATKRTNDNREDEDLLIELIESS